MSTAKRSSTSRRRGPAARAHRRSRIAGAVAVAVLVGGGLAALVRFGDTAVLPGACRVVGTGAGVSPVRLSSEQAHIASVIGGVVVQRKLPTRAAVIGMGTAMQESKLRNLDHGDRDSLGVFQQRPSQGWGTPEQLQDPLYATRAFYDHLVKVPRYTERPLTEVAQDVQRSGFPDAYAKHEPEAVTLAEAFVGDAPHTVTCRLGPTDTTSDPAVVAQQLDTLFGTATRVEGATLTVNTQSVRGAAAIGAWGVAHAQLYGITSVSNDGRTWSRTGDGDSLVWTDDPESGSGPKRTVIRLG